MIVLSLGPTTEVDLFWHLRVGEYTLQGKRFPHPDPFAFTLPDVHWHTTQWLAEAVMAAAYDAAGFGGIVALRLLLTVLLSVGLFRLLVRRSQSWTGPVVMALLAVPVSEFLQDRPQTASLVFLCWLAGVLDRHLADATLPRRWRFVAMTYLWANIHGLFVLAPAFLVLLALLARLSRDDVRRGTARSLLVTAALATAACALTPMGPRLLLAPVTVGAAARDFIVEWAATNVMVFGALSFYVLLGVLLLAASRAQGRRTYRDLAYVAVVAVLGLVAIRNVAPASILLAPVTVRWLDAAWPRPASVRVPRRLVTVSAAVVLPLCLVAQVGRPALGREPRRVGDYLAAQPQGTRVLNDYNVSGYLVFRAHNVRVAVDGRADRYGSAFLRRYADAVRGAPSWRKWVDSLDADVAVLPEDSVLPELLQHELGWKRLFTDDHLVVLRAPGAERG